MAPKRTLADNSSSSARDVFYRSHVVEHNAKPAPTTTYNEPQWPQFALIFDTETTLDPQQQALIFGFYRVCQLHNGTYRCVEEGIFHADDLKPGHLEIIRRYVRKQGSEVATSEYDGRLHVYSRSEFVEKVFFNAVRTRSLIVAFNAPWDISRLAVGWRTSRNRGWTLILSQRVSRKTGQLEPNPERPCMRVTSKDAKAAFFSLTKPVRPKEWPLYDVGGKTRLICRVLDLHTLAWALFNESYSLKGACNAFNTEHKKFDHEPTGTVTADELEYCRQDVRCTQDVLNELKVEFDKHPIRLHPDKAVSPASIGKAYLRAMGITPLLQKFDLPDYIHGIASQAYFGGRAECRIRHTPVPVVLTDFSSQYPTVNSLLGNPELLVAERLTFEDATSEVQAFIDNLTLDACFRQATWKQMKFFALIRPKEDIVPVRAEYDADGLTKNIGVNYFTSSEPVWLSGPDVIASKLLTGRTPQIEKAIRMVPQGQQKGLKARNLRGMVKVDPRKSDLFAVMVEQRQVYKESNDPLSYFLKIAANSTSYGMFYELTPKRRYNPVRVTVYSGEHRHEQSVTRIEKPGEWYFPPVAALITGGAHLLLAMLERCITDRGGQYLFCDTDSMCIVANRNGGMVPCPNEPEIKALSWKDVEKIVKRFESLNCYDKAKVPGSILKIEKVNFQAGKQVELFGYGISAKRYALYNYSSQGNIIIVDAKAHGLGYLYPPKDAAVVESEMDWVFEVWHWILQAAGIAAPQSNAKWLSFPAMMRITVSTPAVLGLLKGFTRPFNFLLAPLLFPNLYPNDKESSNFSLIMPYSTLREEWLDRPAFDVHTGERYSIGLLERKRVPGKVEVKCYGNVLSAYREHPEAKFVGHDGTPCHRLTRGLLRRSHIVANMPRYIGKETSRRWEQGDDMSIVDFKCTEYSDGKVTADPATREQIRKIGIRKLARQSGTDRKTVALIAKGESVKPVTLEMVARYLTKTTK